MEKYFKNIKKKLKKKYNTYFQYYKILLNTFRKPKPHPALIDFDCFPIYYLFIIAIPDSVLLVYNKYFQILQNIFFINVLQIF